MCFPGIVAAECIDYGHYIRWIGGYNPTIGSGNFELDIAVSGTKAYVTFGSKLQIVDISTPGSPVLLGSVTLGVGATARATGVTVVGSIAYVTDAYAGFYVVNVSNPASPVVMGSVDTPGVAEDVAIAGTIAYVADHTSGLQVINVSNPASPTIIGNVDTPDRAFGVALSGTVAYVADQYSGLQIINISNPNSPQIIGSLDTPGNAEDLRAVGTTIYLSDATGGLRVIDASNPLSPVMVGSVDTPGYAWDVAISGTLAYVADDAPGLQVIDLSNPASPGIVASKETPSNARAIAVSGTTAFVLDATYGLGVIDVSHPISPPVTGSMVVGSWSADKVVVSGSSAYVAAGYLGFAVMGVSNPTTPTQIGSVAMPGQGQSGQSVYTRDVAVVGTIAYAAYSRFIPPTGPIYAGLAVIDVANPVSPQILGYVETSGVTAHTTVAANGSNAFLCERDKLLVINASDPSHPVIVGTLSGFGTITGIAVSGSVAYVACSDGNGHLRTVDVSTPGSPMVLGTATFSGIQAKQVALLGQFAYVTVLDGQVGGASGLRVVQVSSPQTPTLVASMPLVGRTQSLAVSGTYLYVGADNGGIQVVDVSNPASPTLIGNSDVYANAVAADESWVYTTTTPGFSILPNQCASQTAVGPDEIDPGQSILGLAFPNPLDRSTTIPFTLASGGVVRIRILDVSGREVRVLLDERLGAGAQGVGWDGRDAKGNPVKAGIYVYELRALGSQAARKLVRIP